MANDRISKTLAVKTMYDKWRRDEKALERLFADEGEFSDGVEMKRNLGTAIAYAASFLRAIGEDQKR